ncbi:MAG: addiction module antitoxin, partial [Rhodoblastus sp.]
RQAQVWELIEAWAEDRASDADKATLREKVRTSALSRRAAIQAKTNPNVAALATRAKAAYAALEPSDLLNKHDWLFRQGWVDESADEIEGIEKVDFQERDRRIQKLRTDALREIFSQFSYSGLLNLAGCGKAYRQIGWLAANDLLSEAELQEFLLQAFRRILDAGSAPYPFEGVIAGALLSIADDQKRERILKGVVRDFAEDVSARLLVLAPFRKSTWNLVDALGDVGQCSYWSRVVPDWIDQSDVENNEAVERLLKAGRPRAAFSCIRLRPERVDPTVLFRLLTEIAQGGKDQPGEDKLAEYDVEKAFKHIHGSTALTLDQMAALEFSYLEVLARPWDHRSDYGIPNLQRYIEAHPELFVQAIVWLYKRKDGAIDPAELKPPTDRAASMAERGYKLLEALDYIPGHNDLGELEANRLA